MTARRSFVALLLFLLVVLIASCAEPQQPTLDVTPTSGTLVSGQSVQLTVTRLFLGGAVDDVTPRVMYASSNRGVASVTTSGLVTAGLEAGPVLVRVVDPSSGATAVAAFTVSEPRIDSIDVAPATAITMVPGTSRSFTATARLSNGTSRDVTSQVQWASSNDAAAVVSHTAPDFGLVTAIAEGDATITATDPATLVQGRSLVFVRGAAPQLKAVVVTPNPGSVSVGMTVQLAAQGVYSDGRTKDMTRTVGWGSSRADIATVDATGLATGVAAGTTTITASAPSSDPSVLIRGSALLQVP